jgi:predicted amidophosphoribosyltransferase
MFSKSNMQLQIECNSLKHIQTCLVCQNQFQMSEARLIVCNDRGEPYGDVCPHCITRGGQWIGSQLNLSFGAS